MEMIYKNAIPTPKDQCSKGLQLGISFTGGYVAGVLCAIVSHPADNLVSFLNNAKGATASDVSLNVPNLGLQGHIFFSINIFLTSICVVSFLFVQAIKQIGLVGLFTRGLPLRIVMIGTLTGAQWGIYDSFKVLVGL